MGCRFAGGYIGEDFADHGFPIREEKMIFFFVQRQPISPHPQPHSLWEREDGEFEGHRGLAFEGDNAVSGRQADERRNGAVRRIEGIGGARFRVADRPLNGVVADRGGRFLYGVSEPEGEVWAYALDATGMPSLVEKCLKAAIDGRLSPFSRALMNAFV